MSFNSFDSRDFNFNSSSKKWKSISRKVGTISSIGRQFTLDDIDEIRDKVGGVDFQQAAREGDVKIVKQYLNSRHFLKKYNKKHYTHKSPIDKLDNQGIAALHYAARYNNVGVMGLLLEKGADINIRDSEGQTPMHHATRYAPKGTALNPEQVCYVPRGPRQDDSQGDDDGEETEETEEEDTDVLQDLEGQKEKSTPMSVEDAVVAKLKTFMKRTSTKRIQKTLEDQIAEDEGSEPIRFLQENGADVNAQDHYGLTPLHCASDRGNYAAVVELLKIDNVFVDMRDYQGETALHMAIMFEDVSCIKKLLYNKHRPCDPKIYSNTNMSPLHFATREAQLDIVELVFNRIKGVEMKENLDSILRDNNEESRRILRLCQAVGVPSIVNCSKPLSGIVKLLHAEAKKVDPVNYAEVRKMVDDKVDKAIVQTDHKMKEHINRAGQERMTCLHLACRDGRADVVNFLIQNGASLKAQTVDKDTCLHIAAKHGHTDVVTQLLKGGCPKEAKNRDGETALHEAAKANQSECIDILLEAGVKINANDRDGSTPLITAAAWGRKETVLKLLELGADVSARDKRENSAIFAAIREDEPDVLKMILDHGGERLIDSELDKFQNTPLHFAAEQGHLACLKTLLEFGFECNAQNEDDMCPLHLAAEYGRIRCATELVKYDKATLDDNDDLSNTPLHYAAQNGHAQTCIYLCEMGAEVGARNQTGWTPMDCAAANGNTKTLSALIDADAEIDPIDKAKLTPLHLASKNGHVDSVIFLLDNGADIRLVDVNHLNALELAVLANKKDVAEAIINHGDTWMKAMANAQENGDTPMKKLIRKMPDIAEIVMNNCTDLSNNPTNRTTDSRKFEVQFNYKYITERYELPEQDQDTQSEESMSDTESEGSASRVEVAIASTESYHVHPLKLMINYKRKELLNHPLVTSLVFCKWKGYGQHFYYGNLLIYTLFLALLTVYTIYQIPPYIAVKNETGEFDKVETCIKSQPNCTKEDSPGYHEKKEPIAYISGLLVLCLCVIRIIIEVMQIWFQKMKYLTLQNFVEIALFLLSIYFTSNVFVEGVLTVLQWQLGVFCLLCAWGNMLMFLQKFPGIGIYIVMFVEVLQTFLKIGVVLLLFVVAFGLTFHMVLDQYPAYKDGKFAILRTFVMMTGEMEYDSYFIPTTLDGENPLYYPESTYLMFIIFVVVVPIVFMNLLVGLAVDDIKEVYNNAELRRSIMKIELLFQVEMLLPKSYLDRKNRTKKTFYPNIKPTVLTSSKLARYVGRHQLPFNGTELHSRITEGDGTNEIKAIADTNKKFMGKLKKQISQMSKENKIMLSLMKKMMKRQMDSESIMSSEMNELLEDDSDHEINVDDD